MTGQGYRRRRTAALIGALCLTVGLAGAAIVSADPAHAASGESGRFTPLTSTRLLDTRTTGGVLRANEIRPLVVAGRGGVPESGASAVLVTITVTGQSTGGYVSVFPDGTNPGTSTVNFAAAQTIANSTVVALPADGTIDLQNGTAGTLHVIVDVMGWYSAEGSTPAAGGLLPVAQRRLLDTRVTHNPLQGMTPLRLPVAGTAGVPADAIGVAVNVTAVLPTQGTYITVWPAGRAQPGTSILNPVKGSVVANLAIVGLGTGGALSLVAGSGTTNVVVDLLGYITGNGGTADVAIGGTNPIQPYRVLDTRKMGTKQPLGAGQTIEAIGSSAVGVPVSGVAALVVTVTTVNSTGSGAYITAWPSGVARPTASILNVRTDRPVPATVVIPVGADGGINLYNSFGSTHIIVDVAGWIPVAHPAVTSIRWSTMDTTPVNGDAAAMARQVLLTANRYALSTWWPTEAQTLLAAPMDSNAQADTSDAVRRLSMEAMSLSVSLRTGAYDPRVVGVSRDTAESVAIQLIDAVASKHIANRAGGWGDSWQSGLWSDLAGSAGWYLWDDLPADTQTRVARMVEWEADQSLLVPLRLLRNRAGTVLTAGNTGAEEDASFALPPALATAMFPSSPHWSAWRHQQELLQINGWARPADVSSATLVDGLTTSAWLQGSNVEGNGSLINHNRIAPDYSTTTAQNIETVMFAALAGKAAPQSTLAGLNPVHAALYTIRYTTPTYQSPGGTVFTVGSPTVYYPQGCDWGLGQQLPYALFDAQAAVFGFAGNGAAASQALLHTTAEATMQARNSTGATYPDGSTEYIYVGREEHSAQLAAALYFTYFIERLGFTIAPSYSPWSPIATVVGVTPQSVTAFRMAPTDEHKLMISH